MHTNGLVIHWAARYDLLAFLFTGGRERAFRERLVDLARVQPGDAVLDIGCGTGTLAVAAARRAGPGADVCGLDASPEMIGRAARKAARAGVAVAFEVGAAEAPRFADGRFDVVLATLMLHHLPRRTRDEAAQQVRRVLKPGGCVLAVDFGKPSGRGLFAHLHRHGYLTLENMVALFERAGLRIVETGAVGVRDLYYVRAERPPITSRAR
jgi:ubiquinone/menaquinone biosynthesis C-methylase UbiE